MCDYLSHYEKQFTQLYKIATAFCCLLQHPSRFIKFTPFEGIIPSYCCFPKLFSALLCLSFCVAVHVQINIFRNNCIIYTFSLSLQPYDAGGANGTKHPKNCCIYYEEDSEDIIHKNLLGGLNNE